MNINLLYFVRLFYRHIPLFVVVPMIMAMLIFYLTSKQQLEYFSKTLIYTGIASGASIDEDDARKDFYATNNAFDNLINLINSKRVLEEVGIKLFAYHVSMTKPDKEIVSEANWEHAKSLLNPEMERLVVKGNYKATFDNFIAVKKKSVDNFITGLSSYNDPFYGVMSISSRLKAYRVQSSDIIEINFTSTDPGICKQTLEFVTETFIDINSGLKENLSDAIVAYFEAQLAEANNKLDKAESDLLRFNMENNIINYYEQTKSISTQKEKVDLDELGVKMRHASADAVVRSLENRMSADQKNRLASSEILTLRDQLKKVSYRIELLKVRNLGADIGLESEVGKELAALLAQEKELNKQLFSTASKQFDMEHDPKGFSKNNMLEDWFANVVQYEGSAAEMKVIAYRQLQFDTLYDVFAPVGASLKRLERIVNTAEEEYLSILYSLSLAKLKQQNLQFNTNLKILDPAYFPLLAKPSKRKILIAIAFIFGLVVVAVYVLVLDFLDQNLKSEHRAFIKAGFIATGSFPYINPRMKGAHVKIIQDRALDNVVRRLIHNREEMEKGLPFSVVFFSTQPVEGKTFILQHIAERLEEVSYTVATIGTLDNDAVQEEGEFKYELSNSFSRNNSLTSMMQNPNFNSLDYDFVLIELPAIIETLYPVNILKNASQLIFVCRANRAWTTSDKRALRDFEELIGDKPYEKILNAISLNEMEESLGEIPKKRNFIRRLLKNIVTFRFYSKKKI